MCEGGHGDLSLCPVLCKTGTRGVFRICSAPILRNTNRVQLEMLGAIQHFQSCHIAVLEKFRQHALRGLSESCLFVFYPTTLR